MPPGSTPTLRTGALAAPAADQRCPGCSWTVPTYVPADLVTYALHDHRHACAAPAGSPDLAVTAIVECSAHHSFALLAPSVAVAAAIAVTTGHAPVAAVVAASVMAVAAVRWGYQAALRRAARRQVHRLMIDLDPDYRAELTRDADAATDGSIPELIRQAIALHRYVWDHSDAELLIGTDASAAVVRLALCSHRRSLARRAAWVRRWTARPSWSPFPPRRRPGDTIKVQVGNGDGLQ